MKLEINISDQEEERIIVYARELTAELNRIVQYIEKEIYIKQFYGRKENNIYPLDLNEILRFYSENKKIIVETTTNKLFIDKRLYELEKSLPRNFIRISQSEIVNLHFIKKLRQEMNGFIKIYFKNGEFTYSSRRYVKMIKEALQL